MNQKLEKYFSESQRLVDEAEQKEREKVLSSAGLYDTVIEYAPDDICTDRRLSHQAGYTSCVLAGGQYRFYRQKKVFFDVSDEEFEKICALEKAKEALKESEKNVPAEKAAEKPIEYTFESVYSGRQGFGAKYMKGLSWFLWIGGLILSIVTAFVEEPLSNYSSYRTETVFHWEVFFQTLSTYGVFGSLTMCASEMLENIHSIASAVRKYRIKK